MVSIPQYIEGLQRDMENSHCVERVLLKYAYCITRDVTLAEIYRTLGFNAEKNCFAGVLEKERVAELISQEYGVVAHSNVESLLAASVTATPTKTIEYDEELRNSFLRTYTDTKLSRIAQSSEIGIDFAYGEAKENEFYTPLHKRHLFSTPRPSRTYHSVSTRASRLITPSSVTSMSDDESDFDPVKSSRGLKSLTIQVKQILTVHKNISYQEVAAILTREACGNSSERIREEKNIKRRVYDAINVLIAAGVLDKDERGVFMKTATEKMDTADLEEEVLAMRETIRQKRAQLTDILNRFLAVQHLIHRNAQNKDPLDTVPFPFLVLGAEDTPDNAVHIITNRSCTSLLVKFERPVEMLGDMEVLLHMGLHRMSLQMLTHLLPHRDLFKYVDGSFRL